MAFKGTAVIVASVVFYKGLLFTLTKLLYKTHNPYLLKALMRCIKCIDFYFDINEFYYHMSYNIKLHEHLPLLKILSQYYGLEPCDCQPQGCHLDNLYIAIQEGDAQYLDILFGYKNSNRIKNFSQRDLYRLLNLIAISNTGKEKYFNTTRALLNTPEAKNCSVYFDEQGTTDDAVSCNLPLTVEHKNGF